MSAKVSIKAKRIRSANFTFEEKQLLASLVYEHRDIINNSKTDGETCQKKRDAWGQIETEFNIKSKTRLFRSASCLVKFYQNRRRELRMRMEKNEKFIENSSTLKEDTLSELLFETMKDKTVVSLENKYDGDADESVEERLDHTSDDVVIKEEPLSQPDINLQAFSELQTEADSRLLNSSNELQSSPREVDSYELSSNSVKHRSSKIGSSRKLRPRRRPVVQAPTSSRLLKQQSYLVRLKKELIKLQINCQNREERRKEEEFQLRKEALQLDILMKKNQLRQLNQISSLSE